MPNLERRYIKSSIFLAQQLAQIAHQLRETLLLTSESAEVADLHAQALVCKLFMTRFATSTKPNFPFEATLEKISQVNSSLSGLLKELKSDNKKLIALLDEGTSLLEQTDLSAFLQDFKQVTHSEDPILHFYEIFLKAYNPQMRQKQGVYYTPQPLVSYVVRSVNLLLQTHFGKPLGLADAEIIIFDPAIGTGAFLHTAIQQINTTFRAHNPIEKWDNYVSQNLLPRLLGFELLLPPYILAHLNLGFLLTQFGYIPKPHETLQISLKNALAAEYRLAPELLARSPIMVLLGNPPYANYGKMNKSEWLTKLLMTYKEGLHERKHNLEDDFLKFFRFGQWQLDQLESGILALVTNNTYLDGLTHRRMRESLLESFTESYILHLHGSRRRQEIAPNGLKDENIFAIQQGVSLSFFVKKPTKPKSSQVFFAECWGSRQQKYTWLQENDLKTTNWASLQPKAPYFFFLPKNLAFQTEYESYPSLKEIFLLSGSGVETQRDAATIRFTRAEIVQNVTDFEHLAEEELASRYGKDKRDWKISTAKADLAQNAQRPLFRALLYRPFDFRWTWYSGKNRGFIGYPSYPIMRHLLKSTNIALICCRQQAEIGFQHVFCTEIIAERHTVSLKTREAATLFPLFLEDQCPNFAPAFLNRLEERLGYLPQPKTIFSYIYAILHSSTYRKRYAELLQIDFPHLPLTQKTALFSALATKGQELLTLHLLHFKLSPYLSNLLTEKESFWIEKVFYDSPKKRIKINAQQSFEGVEREVWEMRIGSYQPLRRWLKERQGRSLMSKERQHYQKMIVALRETQRIMPEIDALIPSWPLL